ncbi:MAG: type II toxin-antitoxin system PemK/MazF family toxin [Candidatus Rokubacteria bacterium]|nr:type II toxin-antitoxin system PemK/MazF family toxin [Candidatus Rokubacteria bacterium]
MGSGPAPPACPQTEAALKQYEIRWANLPLPIGRRPVLLLTRTPAYAYLSRVIVVEVTTTVRGIPQEVPLGRREGLSRPSVANMDNVHVVAKVRIGDLLGALPDERHHEVKRALGYAFDWPELKIL